MPLQRTGTSKNFDNRKIVQILKSWEIWDSPVLKIFIIQLSVLLTHLTYKP